MVVLVVLVLLATAAQIGLRRNERSGQRRRFIADVVGAVTRARDVAIDEQSPVRVELRATSMRLSRWDAANEQWTLLERITVERSDRLSLVDDGVCIAQLDPGVFVPVAAGAISTPEGCIEDPQFMRFEPDGSASPDPGPLHTGLTLWIRHHSPAGPPGHTTIEIFSGGLIRVFEDAP